MTCEMGPAPLPSAQATGAVCGEQVTVVVLVSAHLASPSETVSVMVTGPAVVQVKRGLADVASVKVPAGAVQAYVNADGSMSLSCAVAARPIELPTRTSAGLA